MAVTVASPLLALAFLSGPHPSASPSIRPSIGIRPRPQQRRFALLLAQADSPRRANTPARSFAREPAIKFERVAAIITQSAEFLVAIPIALCSAALTGAFTFGPVGFAIAARDPILKIATFPHEVSLVLSVVAIGWGAASTLYNLLFVWSWAAITGKVGRLGPAAGRWLAGTPVYVLYGQLAAAGLCQSGVAWRAMACFAILAALGAVLCALVPESASDSLELVEPLCYLLEIFASVLGFVAL